MRKDLYGKRSKKQILKLWLKTYNASNQKHLICNTWHVISKHIKQWFSFFSYSWVLFICQRKEMLLVLNLWGNEKKNLNATFNVLECKTILGGRISFAITRHCLQKYPINAGVPQGSILGPTFFLLYISDLPDDVICNIAIYTDNTTLYSKCDQASDLWQQLELASEFESDLQDTMGWGRKWLVDFSAKKTQPLLFDWLYNYGNIDAEMDGSV